MTSAIKLLPDEPIIIVTIDLPAEQYLSNVESLRAHIGRLAADTCPLYAIFDARNLVDLGFSDVLLLLDTQETADPGSILDPCVIPIVVGNHPMLEIGIKKTWQRFKIQVLWFLTLEDALEFIRAEIDGSAAV